MARLTLAAAVLAAAPAVNAWGTLGHETVAFIAQNYVTDTTASWVQGIVGTSNSTYMASFATWADSYRYTSAGKFSEPFHFIDANDSPPSSCNVDYDRDCGSDNCVVSAISNYTERVTDGRLSQAHLFEAMKFIIHFLGDIHQPLHDEALEVGGNDIDVTFDGTSTNLHHIWDTNMPEKLVGGYELSDAQSWAGDLISDIDSGSYSSQKESWLDGMDASDAQGSAMGWASDANAYVCSVVMPNGQSSVEGQELDGAYYNSAIPTIELQIAKAGYRLAAWLNLLNDGSTGLSKRSAREIALEKRTPIPVLPATDRQRNWIDAQRARRAASHQCGSH